MSGLRVEILDSVEAAERHREQWDALAIACARPYCAPAWMLAWWRHVSRSDSSLRVLAAHEQGELVGIAPFCCERTALRLARYRLLGSGTSPRIEPLARAGREYDAAVAFAGALRAARPRPHIISLEGLPSSSPWPELLASSWPGRLRPVVLRDAAVPAPVVEIESTSYEGWFGSRSSNFRSQMRRSRKALEQSGAHCVMAGTADELDRALTPFAALHHSRWEARGGSDALDVRVEAMLREAGPELVADGRLRLWSTEVDGTTISAQLFVAAGGEVAYWLGGFDDRWARQRPALLGILAAIEDAGTREERRVDLGSGAQDYKYRMATGEEMLEWLVLLPRGPRYPLARLGRAPRAGWRALKHHLPEAVTTRLRAVIHTLGRS